MTLATVVAFSIWSFSQSGTDMNAFLLILAIAFGLFMAFNIGGNDVANSFGTSVGAGTLTMKQALVVAAVFEVSGAVLAGGSVTKIVDSGIVDIDGMDMDPMSFAYIMMAALAGAAIWLLLATRMGWPVSSHARAHRRHRRRGRHHRGRDRHRRIRHGQMERDRKHRDVLGALPPPRCYLRLPAVRRDQAPHPRPGGPCDRARLARLRRRRGR